MKYMLDTNICIYIIKKKPGKVLQIFQALNVGDVCISAITFAELQYGAYNSQQQKRNKVALLKIEILPFTDKATSLYGEIRADLEKRGQIIGVYDLLIAAHALSEDLILVTNNIKAFNRIPKLRLQNWTE